MRLLARLLRDPIDGHPIRSALVWSKLSDLPRLASDAVLEQSAKRVFGFPSTVPQSLVLPLCAITVNSLLLSSIRAQLIQKAFRMDPHATLSKGCLAALAQIPPTLGRTIVPGDFAYTEEDAAAVAAGDPLQPFSFAGDRFDRSVVQLLAAHELFAWLDKDDLDQETRIRFRDLFQDLFPRRVVAHIVHKLLLPVEGMCNLRVPSHQRMSWAFPEIVAEWNAVHPCEECAVYH